MVRYLAERARTIHLPRGHCICVDEVEAAGPGTTGKLEGNVRGHISAQNLFRYIGEGKERQARMFGGVNTLFWEIGGSSGL